MLVHLFSSSSYASYTRVTLFSIMILIVVIKMSLFFTSVALDHFFFWLLLCNGHIDYAFVLVTSLFLHHSFCCVTKCNVLAEKYLMKIII